MHQDDSCHHRHSLAQCYCICYTELHTTWSCNFSSGLRAFILPLGLWMIVPVWFHQHHSMTDHIWRCFCCHALQIIGFCCSFWWKCVVHQSASQIWGKSDVLRLRYHTSLPPPILDMGIEEPWWLLGYRESITTRIVVTVSTMHVVCGHDLTRGTFLTDNHYSRHYMHPAQLFPNLRCSPMWYAVVMLLMQQKPVDV